MMMNDIVSARPMLTALSQGDLMRNVMGRFVQVLAVLVGIALFLSWVGMWSMIETVWSWGALALTLTQVVLLVAFAKMVQVIFARGEDIRNTPESEFTMMAIFATLVRLPGEVLLVLFGLFSLPAALLTWTGASHIVAMLGVPLIEAHTFITGLAAFITCWIMGFAAFVLFSLVAEMTSAIFSIAHDLRSTRKSLESGSSPHSMPTQETHARAA